MLEAGQVINNRYQLKQQLGNNPIRVTWLATDLNTTENVVVKLLAFGGNVQWDEVKLFEREAQTLQNLDHDRIPKYRDYFSLDDRTLWFGLVQEYIPGYNFKDVLTQGKRFKESEVKTIATQVLEILVYLHGLTPPVFHRDIKPSNLIMGDDGKIYVVDFGAVQDKASREGVTFTVVGTYGYAPMEQFSGKTLPSSDLYALGATLIHLMTGVSPAELPTKELKIQFRHLITSDSALMSWLEKMAEPIPEKRFATALEAATNLLANKRNNHTSLGKNKHNKIQTPAKTRVKVIDKDNQLIINIPARSNNWFKSWRQIVGSWSVVCLFFFFFINLRTGIFWPLLIFVFGLGYSFVTNFFQMTQLEIDKNYKFSKETSLWQFKSINYTDYTEHIQDVSLKYLKEEGAQQAPDCLMIITRHPGSDRFSRYDFGKGLSELELLWLVQVIRDWLNR